MRRMTSLALLVVVAAALFGVSAQARRATAYCNSTQLTGHFTAVRGSAGAGNIVYALVLRNRSSKSCAVTGLPQVTLLGLHGKALPTHVRAASANLHAAPLIQLGHGDSASATARFSPDVPGPGEQKRGACEPKAYGLAVNDPGGGVTAVRVQPPTPVCEHGQLQFKVYTAVH
jgi:hypothetical protein